VTLSVISCRLDIFDPLPTLAGRVANAAGFSLFAPVKTHKTHQICRYKALFHSVFVEMPVLRAETAAGSTATGTALANT